jgi:hypothetical protein
VFVTEERRCFLGVVVPASGGNFCIMQSMAAFRLVHFASIFHGYLSFSLKQCA